MALFGRKKTEEKKTAEPKKAAVVKSEKIKSEKKKNEKPKAVGVKKYKVEKKDFSDAWRILKQPLITEKSGNLTANFNQYVFKVEKSANKDSVRRAIGDLYGVRVERVNIMKIRRKAKRVGKYLGHTAGYKKAVITLAEGEKIESGV